MHLWSDRVLLMAEREPERVQIDRPRANIAQACAIAGVSRRTIYYWIEAGKIEYVRTASGSIRIYVDTLLRLSSE